MKNRKQRDDFFPRWFIAVWAIGALISVSVVGVIIWAVIRFVLEFTG